MDRVEFEKWAESEWESYYEASAANMNAAQEGWNARQPEIDALKAERDAHRDNAQCLVEENAALKAEAEKWKRLLEDRAVSKYNFETTVERETMKEPK